MEKRIFINAMLATLLGLILILVFIKSETKQNATKQVTPLVADEIDHIEIIRPGKASIELQLTEDGWYLVGPLTAPALPGKMDRLLKIAAIPSSTQYIIDPEVLSQYGLDQPIASIRFNQTQLDIGQVEPIKQRRYVRTGNTLHLLDDTFMHHLMGKPTDYIDTRILPDGVQISRLQLPGLHLIYTAGQGWRDQANPDNELQPDQVQILVDEWRFARAINIEEMSEDFQGQDAFIAFESQPGLHLLIDNQPEHLRMANPSQGLIYHFSHTKAEKMLRFPISITPSN